MSKEEFNETEHEEWLYHLGANGIRSESLERLLDELFPVEVALQALRELRELKEKT